MECLWDGYDDIIDVRSPTEYADDCIPGALNLPVLSDGERAEVGILHKTSPFAARRRGAGMLASNLSHHLETQLAEHPSDWRPLIYCWRGGQRSGAVVEVLRRIGWDAQLLPGGYKAYRHQVMEGITGVVPRLSWVTVGGKTGSGKTRLLELLSHSGNQMVDLEGLCNHRGSAFGGAGAQPSQRGFESQLFAKLRVLSAGAPVFVEGESRKIGVLHLPKSLLSAMRAAPVAYMEVSLGMRARYIAAGYHGMRVMEDFDTALGMIAKYVGIQRVSSWRRLHELGEWENLAEDMLSSFYDIGYEKSLSANYGEPALVLSADPNSEESMLCAEKKAASFFTSGGG